MPAILRIDVDRAYENRMLHYMRVNQELFMGIDSLGYLESCKDVIKDLDDRGIKASIFFQPFTVPNEKIDKDFIKNGSSAELHAVHTKKFKSFLRVLENRG